MELRQLRYFATVADHLSFSRAAESLHIAQSAVSTQIQLLEKELGVTLFRRTKRAISLTNVGELVLEQVRRTLLDAEDVQRIARLSTRGGVGRLKVAFSPMSPFSAIAKIVRVHRERYPNVELEPYNISTPEQIVSLRARKIDIAILRNPRGVEDLSTLRLASAPLYVALANTNPLSGKQRVRMGDLRNEKFILFARSTGEALFDEVVRMAAEAGFTPFVIQEMSEARVGLSLVSAGLGIAILDGWISQDRPVEGVVYRQLVPKTLVDIVLAWLQSPETPVLRAFVDTCRHVMAEEHGP